MLFVPKKWSPHNHPTPSTPSPLGNRHAQRLLRLGRTFPKPPGLKRRHLPFRRFPQALRLVLRGCQRRLQRRSVLRKPALSRGLAEGVSFVRLFFFIMLREAYDKAYRIVLHNTRKDVPYAPKTVVCFYKQTNTHTHTDTHTRGGRRGRGGGISWWRLK